VVVVFLNKVDGGVEVAEPSVQDFSMDGCHAGWDMLMLRVFFTNVNLGIPHGSKSTFVYLLFLCNNKTLTKLAKKRLTTYAKEKSY
jgi:hypothetical protein